MDADTRQAITYECYDFDVTLLVSDGACSEIDQL